MIFKVLLMVAGVGEGVAVDAGVYNVGVGVSVGVGSSSCVVHPTIHITGTISNMTRAQVDLTITPLPFMTIAIPSDIQILALFLFSLLASF